MDFIIIEEEIAYQCKCNQNYYITKTGKLYSVFVKGAHGKKDLSHPHLVAYGQDKDGYYRVVLSNNKKRQYITIHTLVAEQFISDIPDGMVVNHKDGNIHNNNYSNLEIVTPRENVLHAWRMGLASKEKNPNCIKVDIFDKVKNELIHVDSIEEAKNYVGCSSRYINCIKNNNSIYYSYCFFEKIKFGTKNTEYYLNCYFNGKLVKIFRSNGEAGRFFGKSNNTISSFVTTSKRKNELLNKYIITFPNVSTIESVPEEEEQLVEYMIGEIPTWKRKEVDKT